MTSNEFETHSVFEKVEQLIVRLSEQEIREKIDLEKLNFFDTSCKYIKDRIKLTLPTITPIAEFSTIAQEIENAIAQINSFIGNGNVGHLTNAEGHLNSALVRVRNLPFPFAKNDFNFAKAISNFEEIVKSKYVAIEKENTALKEELTTIKNSLIDKQTQITQITDLLSAKSLEIANLTSTYQTDYNNIKASANQNFEADRKTFRSEITNDRNTFRTEVTVDRSMFRKEIDDKITAVETKTIETVNIIESKLEEAMRLVNVIGNVGVTGNYQNIANEHKKTANIWRFAAIGFMSILSGLLIYAIWDVSSASYDWVKSLIRVIAAAALSYPATYAARESSKHRKLENLNRKLELELAALTPFIEMLDEQKKKDIKAELVKRYFGNSFESTEDKTEKEEELSLGGFEKILKAIIPFLKK